MKRKINFIYLLTTLLLFSLPAISQPVLQDDKEAVFAKGVEFYTAADYESALNEWLSIYQMGYNSVELCYNIGNAYFKLNNTPGSILFYERAALRDPANEDVNYNLQIAKTLVVDRFEEIPELFFIRWYNLFVLILKSNTWAIISIVSFVICLAFLSLYFFTSNYKAKVAGFWIAVVMFLISVVSLSCSIRSKDLVYNSESAIIFSPQVRGKSSPDNSGTDLFILHEGTKVDITDKVGEWLEIRLSDGNKGWVPVSSLEVI